MDLAAPNCGGGPVNGVLVEQLRSVGILVPFWSLQWLLSFWKWSLITLISPENSSFSTPFPYWRFWFIPSLQAEWWCHLCPIQFSVYSYMYACAEALRRRVPLIFSSPLNTAAFCCACVGVDTLPHCPFFFFCAKGQFSTDASHLFVLPVPLSCKRDVPDPRQRFTPSM